MARTVIALSLACAVLAVTLAVLHKPAQMAAGIAPASERSWGASDDLQGQALEISNVSAVTTPAAPRAMVVAATDPAPAAVAAATPLRPTLAVEQPVAKPVSMESEDQIADDAAAVGMTTREMAQN